LVAWNTACFPKMLCYRIVKPAWASSALSGEGARLYGGRWNPHGRACVYAAGSRALAVLEMLVHLQGRSRTIPYRILTVEIDDDSISRLGPPSPGWDARPAGRASQHDGLEWLKAGRTVALLVPSVIIPEESNILLNPNAPGFQKIRIIDEHSFQLDELKKRLGVEFR